MFNVFAPFNLLYIVVLLVCAAAYYRLADLDPEASAIIWTGLSLAMFLITWLILRWGLLGDLFGQFALFAGITLFRALRSRGGPT
jgi:hypothetical protein